MWLHFVRGLADRLLHHRLHARLLLRARAGLMQMEFTQFTSSLSNHSIDSQQISTERTDENNVQEIARLKIVF